jgi:hypothetical protein
MIQPTRYRTLTLYRRVYIFVAVAFILSLLALNAAAQEPTPEVTPTAGVPVAPTPGTSPADRFIDFRVDDDDIDTGECVEFSWVVRGDVDRVEFDKRDDDKGPVLVAGLDDRQECPTEDTNFELIVRWLDKTKTTRKIEIEVHNTVSNDGSSSNNNSNGGSTTDSGVINTTAGVFVQVTPILITNTLFNIRVTPVPGSAEAEASTAAAAIPAAPGEAPVKPSGILGTIHELPETGSRAIQPQPFSALVGGWLILAGGFIFTLGLFKLMFRSS